MNKTKYLTLRVTEKEMETIRGKASVEKLTISEWVLKCLLEDLREKVKKKGVPKIDRTYPTMITEGKDFIHIEDNTPKCQSPNCPSLNTKEYQRATGKFWLCDTHKP